MKRSVSGWLLLACSVVLHIAALAAFMAMLQALAVSSTISAVESAFGTFVLLILLLVFARKSWQIGKIHIKSTD